MEQWPETCPGATMSTTNLTWTDLGSNTDLRGERSTTDRLSPVTAIKVKINLNYKTFRFLQLFLLLGANSPSSDNSRLPIWSCTSILELTAKSPEKSETMTFLGQDPVRCKTTVHNKGVQHVNNFKYFGLEISHKNEKDIEEKPAKFAQILGIRNKNCEQNLVQKLSTIKVHNALAVPIL